MKRDNVASYLALVISVLALLSSFFSQSILGYFEHRQLFAHPDTLITLSLGNRPEFLLTVENRGAVVDNIVINFDIPWSTIAKVDLPGGLSSNNGTANSPNVVLLDGGVGANYAIVGIKSVFVEHPFVLRFTIQPSNTWTWAKVTATSDFTGRITVKEE